MFDFIVRREPVTVARISVDFDGEVSTNFFSTDLRIHPDCREAIFYLGTKNTLIDLRNRYAKTTWGTFNF